MKTFETLAALADHNNFLAEHIAQSIDRSDRDEPFMWSLGGDVSIIETAQEARVFLMSNGYFDIFDPINDSWIMAVVINNNSGGPTTFIPEDILAEVSGNFTSNEE